MEKKVLSSNEQLYAAVKEGNAKEVSALQQGVGPRASD